MLLFAREAWAKGQCRFAILPISNLSRFARPVEDTLQRLLKRLAREEQEDDRRHT